MMPFEKVRSLILNNHTFHEEDLKIIDKEIKEIMNETVEFSQSSPEPKCIRTLYRYSSGESLMNEMLTIREALRDAMAEEMRRDSSVF